MSEQDFGGSPTKMFLSLIDQSKLESYHSTSIRLFLRWYRHCHKEVVQRATKLGGFNTITDESIFPVELRYCVNADWLDFIIDFGPIVDVLHYDGIHDVQLNINFESKEQEDEDGVTIKALDNFAWNDSRFVNDSNAGSRIKNLFASFFSSLWRNGLSGVMKKHQGIAVRYIMAEVRSLSLKLKIESDLRFTKSHVTKVCEDSWTTQLRF